MVSVSELEGGGGDGVSTNSDDDDDAAVCARRVVGVGAYLATKAASPLLPKEENDNERLVFQSARRWADIVSVTPPATAPPSPALLLPERCCVLLLLPVEDNKRWCAVIIALTHRYRTTGLY